MALELLPNLTLIAPGSVLAVQFSRKTANALVVAVAPPAENKNRWPELFVPLKELNRKVIVPAPVPGVPVKDPPPLTRLLLATRPSLAAVNAAALVVWKSPNRS